MMNKFINTKKAIAASKEFWEISSENGLIDIAASYLGKGEFVRRDGSRFINMCSYSYLGLDSHPAIIEGAFDEIRSTKIFNYSITRVRIILETLIETEELLGQVFGAQAISLSSCAAASMAILPLIAAGVFSDNKPPVMVFDRFCHFSLNILKPLCADETEVITAPHNDMDFLEDICKKHEKVVYIAEGVYSTGGTAPVKRLMELQAQYGLILFFDEAHSISVSGKSGRGYALEQMGGINDQTIVVSSLNKGFGAYGGVLLLGPGISRPLVERFGGPIGWSGSEKNNTAVFGAIKASAHIHLSEELALLQAKLQENIRLFDSLVHTKDTGDGLATRLIHVGDPAKTIQIAKDILNEGFYTSPLFFPIVPRDNAGLRVMIRADMDRGQLTRFCQLVNHSLA